MLLFETGVIYASMPPKYQRQWWCGCGKTLEAPARLGKLKSEEETKQREWKRINEVDP